MNNCSKIALGSVQFGMRYGISNKTGQTPADQVSDILSLAQKFGVFMIDTASSYGNAEEILGMNNLSEFKIISKFMPKGDSDNVSDQLFKSLSDLKIDKLYGFLAHRPLDIVKRKWQWNELLSLQKQGIVEKIGFSFNHPSEIDFVLDLGMVPNIIQAPFNYFDNRFEEKLIALKEKGCEIFTRSTFLQGLFFMKTHELSSFFNEVKSLIEELQQGSDTLAGDLLKYVIDQPFIDSIVIGVENAAQFKKNIELLSLAKILPKRKLNISEELLMPSLWPQKQDLI